MRIYLDGVDGSGKSTTAKYLAERFKLDIFCLTKDSESSIKKYCEMRHMDNTVYDRTFLSEIVYPKVFGREPRLNYSQAYDLVTVYTINPDDLFVICTANNNDIRKRIKARGYEYPEILRNVEEINRQYVELARLYEFIIFNSSLTSLDSLGDYIERSLK